MSNGGGDTDDASAAIWGNDGGRGASRIALASSSSASSQVDSIDEMLREYGRPVYAVLFPFTCLSFGVVIYFLLKRFDVAFPYAACMFIVGIIMGIAVIFLEQTDQLSISILQWSKIDPDVLLAVFLPGLVFREAIGVNMNLFRLAFWQIMILAYPMVLLGAALVACVVRYLFPIAWTFNVGMALGSVLASTDPAAVATILKTAGAPPRLEMHISGESLLNDGSSYVIFVIFSSLAYADMGFQVHGELGQVTVGEGFSFFFRQAFGGAAVGVACALCLVGILFELERRADREYDILQVVATLCTAYITYYVANEAADTSGIVACSTAGLLTNALGRGLVNDEELMDTYLALLDHSLNTVLFTLGGVIWGVLVALEGGGSTPTIANREEWGYLFLLFVLGLVIRYVQVFVFYPAISRMGLKSNWREAVFVAYGGVRGAVSIALALFFYRLVHQHATNQKDLDVASSFMFMAGGVSLLSLIISGATGGPVLRGLKLGTPSMGRERALQLFDRSAAELVQAELIRLLSQPRFESVDMSIVEAHVPFLNSKTIHAEEENIRSTRTRLAASMMSSFSQAPPPGHPSHTIRSLANSDAVIQMRQLFLQILKDAYDKMLRKGELLNKDQGGFLVDVLKQSIAFASSAAKDEPLNDWHYTCMFHTHKDAMQYLQFRRSLGQSDDLPDSDGYKKQKFLVLRAVTFVEGHKIAEAKLQHYVSIAAAELRQAGSWDVVESALETVVEESQDQVGKAKESLEGVPESNMTRILSHYVATILIDQLISYVEDQANEGVLNPDEARKYLDYLQHEAVRNLTCYQKSCTKCKPLHDDHAGDVTDAKTLIANSEVNGSKAEGGENDTNVLPTVCNIVKGSYGDEHVTCIENDREQQ